MKSVSILFPHQLFDSLPFSKEQPIYLVEEFLFFSQYAFHKQKIAFHRASMKSYAAHLKQKGYNAVYIDAQDKLSDVRSLIPTLASEGFEYIEFINPVDFLLEKRLKNGCASEKLTSKEHVSPAFLNTNEQLSGFFKPTKKKFFQTSFYQAERKRLNILLESDGSPTGGKWSFDADNRKKYPRKSTPPLISFPAFTEFHEEAISYVHEHFANNLGSLSSTPIYPIDRSAALSWLSEFLEQRFLAFGDYEDAMVQNELILHHSVLSPLINSGLLFPDEVVNRTLQFADKNNIPLNSTEGFIRQIIGWREFIRGMYVCKGVEIRTTNYWGFKRKIPSSFYDGTTGILPLDTVIKKVLETGYCHHIERLMIIVNFMLLCEFDPDEVYRWFMELFIDSYDWVMVPNVYAMSQFADGGLMTTKPYISGSNYIKKMSDFPKGDWELTWDALFWRFMHVHRSFFLSNPRLGMLIGNFDKMAPEKRSTLLETADTFLATLDD